MWHIDTIRLTPTYANVFDVFANFGFHFYPPFMPQKGEKAFFLKKNCERLARSKILLYFCSVLRQLIVLLKPKNKMKKLVFALVAFAAISFASCGGNTATTDAANDSTANDSTVEAIDSAATDSAATDSAAAPVDSAATDSAAAQ